MSKKSRRFAKLGVQLNDKILQKDSEFYSPIRLKQITEPGESQIDALEQRGVKYVEVRILDINPFVKTGISLEQLRFLQVFMLFCLFSENKPIDNEEIKLINRNHHLAALSGRRPLLMLQHPELGKISLRAWGDDIFEKLKQIAKLLDEGTDSNTYSLIVQKELRKIINKSYLPSARLREEMRRRKESFLEIGVRMANEFKSGEMEEL
jgi:glutamate--cysteine ligase